MSFTPTREQVRAAEAVFIAMAGVQTVKPVVRGYQRRVLAELGWGDVDPKHTFTLPDAVFAEYHARCKRERDAAGLYVDDDDFCPLLVTEHLLSDAKNNLIAVMEPVTHLSVHRLLCSGDGRGLEHLEECVQLTLRLLAPYCKERLL